MTSLTNVNFMSQDKFNTIGETSNSEMYLVEGGFFPSDKYEDLTIGADHTEYTAPADGWFTASGSTSGQGMIGFKSNALYSYSWVNTNNGVATYIPVKKSDVVTFRRINVTPDFVRFVYA